MLDIFKKGDSDGQKLRDEGAKKRRVVAAQWQNFERGVGKVAYDDLMDYIDSQREMYRKYAEERMMPSPKGNDMVSIDNETVAALLQNSRGLSIVKVYINNQLEVDVSTPEQQTK